MIAALKILLCLTITGIGTDSTHAFSAPVAQLDRVVASEAIGHRFESCRAHQKQKTRPSAGFFVFAVPNGENLPFDRLRSNMDEKRSDEAPQG